MVRGATVLTAVWALLALPALCVGGVIVHPCDCAATSGCGHEAACWTDPCNTITVRTEQQGDIGMPAPGAASVPVCWTVDLQVFAEAFRVDASESPPCENLPYPRSDIPLLI